LDATKPCHGCGVDDPSPTILFHLRKESGLSAIRRENDLLKRDNDAGAVYNIGGVVGV